MKKGLTELVFILDRSGSMAGLESDTIGGFNSMMEKQRQEPGEACVTTVLFDDQYEVVHDRLSADCVEPMTGRQYYVRGCTALLDAMGRAITHTANVVRSVPESERPEKVIFVVITDGLENASRIYSYDRLKEMIRKEQEEYGWEFLFLGANMDAVNEAARFGIRADRSVTFQNDPAGVSLNYRVVSETVCRMRGCSASSPVGAEWKQEIERDTLGRDR